MSDTVHQIIDRPGTLEIGGEAVVRRVRVRLVDGHIDVVAGTGPARLEVTSLEGPPLVAHLEGGDLTVSYDDLSWSRLLDWVRHGRRRVTASLSVPADCSVELGVVSASAVVAGLRDVCSVRAVSGDVTLDNLGSSVDAQTVSGDLESRSLRGSLRFTTVSGDLTVVDGVSDSVRAKTVSGDVALDLDLTGPGYAEVDSVSGDVTVRVPATTGVQVDVVSTTGALDSAFPGLRRESRPGRGRLEGTIGDGAARLRVRTVSGDVALLAGLPRASVDTKETS
jgi:Toastrack DUF4097